MLQIRSSRRSPRSSWCRPLYDAQSRVNPKPVALGTAKKVVSSVTTAVQIWAGLWIQWAGSVLSLTPCRIVLSMFLTAMNAQRRSSGHPFQSVNLPVYLYEPIRRYATLAHYRCNADSWLRAEHWELLVIREEEMFLFYILPVLVAWRRVVARSKLSYLSRNAFQ